MAMARLLDDEKQIEQSNEYREEGNFRFSKKIVAEYLYAAAFYNSAICFAPTHSEVFYKALVNRSSVYYRLEMYDVCLDNINLIYKYGQCPSSLMSNLKICEEACKNFIAEGLLAQKYEPIEPELSLPANEDDPYVAKCLEMRDRHIITNRDLKVGEIVSILEPLFVVQSERHKYHCCEYCCRENSRNLIPCPGCTTVMFCDENCLGKAMETFHKYECRFVACRNDSLNSIAKLALRAMMCGLSCFDTIDEFLDSAVNAFNRKSVELNKKPSSLKEKYLLACSLSSSVSKLMPRVDSTALMTFCERIFQSRNMSSKKKPSLYKKILKNVVEQHLLLAEKDQTSFFNLSDRIGTNRLHGAKKDDMKMRFSVVIYQFTTFLRHSCVPNVIMTNAGIRQIVSVVRPIKAGDPLLICTKKQFFEMNREERMKELRFECQCIACTENYPLLKDLPVGSLSYPMVTDYQISKLRHFDRIGAQNHYQSTVDILQSNDSDMPCKKLVEFHVYYANIMSTKYCEELSLLMRVFSDIAINI